MKKIVLAILDGWGVSSSWGGNAISTARTINYYKLLRKYPHTILKASGVSVGLPGHEVGNSEVGHMNLGAGKIVEQDISIINKSIKSGEFFENETLLEAIKTSIKNKKSIHLMGILSDAGIHAHIDHVIALLQLIAKYTNENVYLHLFTDGRDTDQYRGLELANKLEEVCKELNCGKIATVLGRALLDRKGNWVRTETAYNALVKGAGIKAENSLASLSQAYRDGESDEYVTPRIIEGTKRIEQGDTVIFFNFRSYRTRQLTLALLKKDFQKFKREESLSLNFISFIPYGLEKELNLQSSSAFEKMEIPHTIAGVYGSNNLKQFHIAETEKYAHVTFFLNGNIEKPYPLEDRLLIPSPNVSSYAESPQMSALKLNAELTKHIKGSDYSFYVANFANGDMVGHTGNFRAAIEAVQTIDNVLGNLVQCCLDEDATLIITADHGNVEQMVNPVYGGPDTEHTKNPVPFIIVSNHRKIILKDEMRLGNVASTILELASIKESDQFDESIIKDIQP